MIPLRVEKHISQDRLHVFQLNSQLNPCYPQRNNFMNLSGNFPSTKNQGSRLFWSRHHYPFRSTVFSKFRSRALSIFFVSASNNLWMIHVVMTATLMEQVQLRLLITEMIMEQTKLISKTDANNRMVPNLTTIMSKTSTMVKK